MQAPKIKIYKKHTLAEQKRVLTKALIRATLALHLSRDEISAIIGPSHATLSRLFNKTAYIDPTSKEGQLALLFLRLYRSLDTLFGGNSPQCELWLRSENKHLSGIPLQLIHSIEGLVLVNQYLDAMRGKS